MGNYVLYILCFFIYSFLGWICESIYCSIGNKRIINRGFLSGPICPIYGFGALAIIFLLNGFMDNTSLLFLYGIIITSVLEYIAGFFLEKIFNTRWWDYSKKMCNIKGRICLKNSILFGVLCVLLMQIMHPILSRFITLLPILLLIALVVLITTIFFIDLSFTVNAINKLNNKLKGLDDVILELNKIPERLQEDRYSNKVHSIKEKSILQRRIINAFPNMKHNKRHEQLKLVMKIIKDKIK